MILDELKLTADDAYFNKEHVLFLMNNYRSLLLQSRYGSSGGLIPAANSQVIRLSLRRAPADDDPSATTLCSEEEIPGLVHRDGFERLRLSLWGSPRGDLCFTHVNADAFRVCTFGKWRSLFAYFTSGVDKHLYLKSVSPEFKYLRQIHVEGIFSDTLHAASLSLDPGCTVVDTSVIAYPLEQALVGPLIQSVCKELGVILYSPVDTENNAFDDIPGPGTSRPGASSRGIPVPRASSRPSPAEQ